MSTTPVNARSADLASILSRKEQTILAEWIKEMSGTVRRSDLLKESELQAQCAQFLRLVSAALESGGSNFQTSTWEPVREMLANISRSRALQGFSPTETASFVFSAKRPIFTQIREAVGGDSEALAAQMWAATELLDAMGLYTSEVYQKSREEVVRRQQEELLELSTPVVKLWEGILALPLIGTLDSARTQVVMESMLDAIVKSNSRIAIIDITGVPTVDTVVAQHLLKTVTAARLMGADCIISGVRPQIAQTIVHLGINLLDVTTKATLSAAFMLALQRLGITFNAPVAKA
ncbi:MAG TPA: STAS domain-containing protein [Candidatus Acidoferrales bacterium]|nr:STAS domain-containing protein [Candidatus Acidoferrales bacterium]